MHVCFAVPFRESSSKKITAAELRKFLARSAGKRVGNENFRACLVTVKNEGFGSSLKRSRKFNLSSSRSSKSSIMMLLPQKWIDSVQMSPKNLRVSAILISIYEIVSCPRKFVVASIDYLTSLTQLAVDCPCHHVRDAFGAD